MYLIAPLNPRDKTPLFKQLHAQMKSLIESGSLTQGTRLPATRELAGQIGLNRTTVSAAYALLESEGLITGHVGRGSFVARRALGGNAGTPYRSARLSRIPASPDRGHRSCCFRWRNFARRAPK